MLFNEFVTAVYSDYDIKDNTWTNCTFDTLWQGLTFGLIQLLVQRQAYWTN